MPRLLYIKLDGGVHTVHSNEACTSSAVVFTQKQGTPFDLSVAFCTAGAAAALADLSGVNVSFKRTDRFSSSLSAAITTPGSIRLLNPNYTISGSAGSTRYNFLTNLQSALVQSDMLLAASVSYDVEITWTLEGSAQTYKTTNTFTVLIESAVYGGTENAPSAALSTSRVIFVDDNYDVLSAQGFNAHVNLQDAIDAALALTPPPSHADPVVIRLGSLSTAGDATINFTDSAALIIQGEGKTISTAGTISYAADYSHAITLQGLTCELAIARGTWGEALDLSLLQSNVTSITTEVFIGIEGDAASRIYLLTCNGINGANGADATTAYLGSAQEGDHALPAPSIMLQGQVVIGQMVVNGGNGGAGGDGNSTYPLGKLGGAGGGGGGITLRGNALVELVTVHVGNAGLNGTSFTGYDPPSGAVSGGGGIVISYDSPYARILEFSTPDGGLDNYGAAGPKAASISYVYPLQLPLLSSDPATPPAGSVLYNVNAELRLKNSAGTVTTLTNALMPSDLNDVLKRNYAADAGSTDSYAATLSPVPAAYVTGAQYRFKANTANTGAATINFNGLGAKTIVKVAGGMSTALATNDIRAGQWVDVVYDGTNMQMQSTLGNAGSFSGIYSDLTGKPTLGTASALDVAASGNAASGEVVKGNDTRLTDARTAFTHATSHKSGGTDAIKLDELSAPTDITTLNATTSAHGLLPKLGGGTTNFLRADGSWAAPAGGGTGGSTNLWIGAGEMIPRVTTGCSINSLESTTNKVNYDVLEFDAATAQYAQISRVMPNNWNAGTITFKPFWTAASGSGDVIWGLQARAFANDDAIDQAFGTAQTSTDTLTTAADLDIGPASSAITIAGSPANGNLVIFQIYRDAAAGGDTLGTAAQLIGIEITFL